ncbi:MAG: lysylphosphatidylglycerol synthase transmembrane domain-containing protein, partial [Acidimicrobiales bacterium]
GVLFVYERPLALVARYVLALSHKLIGRPRGDREARIVAALERIAVVRLHSVQAFGVLAWASLNWFFDCTCFAIAFLAIGSSVPWEGLLLAYGAGQLAANLPITPGGLGAVEGSITIALAYFGGGTSADIAAVLVYRLISFWLVLLVGWSSWGGLALGVRRGRWPRRAMSAPVEPHVVELEEHALVGAALPGHVIAPPLLAEPDAARDVGVGGGRQAP